jgi:hypothetical protein
MCFDRIKETAFSPRFLQIASSALRRHGFSFLTQRAPDQRAGKIPSELVAVLSFNYAKSLTR